MKKFLSLVTSLALLAISFPLLAADGKITETQGYRYGNFFTNATVQFGTNYTFGAGANTLMLSKGEVGLTIQGKMSSNDTNEIVAGTTYLTSSTNANIVKTNLTFNFVTSVDGSNWATESPISVRYPLFGSNAVNWSTNIDLSKTGVRYIKPYDIGATNAIAATNRITVHFLRWGVFLNPN